MLQLVAPVLNNERLFSLDVAPIDLIEFIHIFESALLLRGSANPPVMAFWGKTNLGQFKLIRDVN